MTTTTHAHRYPGARPFEDNGIDRRLFWGRKAEVDKLLHLALSERLVVLYGRSGVGKSSLVNAGLVQRLREADRAPIQIRLSDPHRDLLASVDGAVDGAAARNGWEKIGAEATSLWRYFKEIELWRGDVLLSPVLIFDQFEELFTLHPPDVRRRFIAEFAALVRGGDVPGVERCQSGGPLPQVSVILSLREDFIHHLEEMAPLVPHILHTRIRLGPLSRAQARDAILKPAAEAMQGDVTPPFGITDEAADGIIGFLAHREGSGKSALDVEPFQLQIICQRAEDIARTRHADGQQDVRIEYADLGGDPGLREILTRFYERQVKGLRAGHSPRQVRRLCEEGLINPDRRRLTLEQGDISRRFGVSREVLEELVDRRLLRAEPRVTAAGEPALTYYELSHDSLIGPIRRAWRKRRRRRLQLYAASAAAVVVMVTSVAGYRAYDNAVASRLGKLVEELSGTGSNDPAYAIAIAVNAVSYTLESGRSIPAHHLDLLAATVDPARIIESGQLPPRTRTAVISPWGDRIAAGSDAGVLHVVDVHGNVFASASTGDAAPIEALAIGASQHRIASLQHGGPSGPSLRIWDAMLQKQQAVDLRGTEPAGLAFTPDERALVILARNGDVVEIDTETGVMAGERTSRPETLRAAGQGRVVLSFTADGRWLAASAAPDRIAVFGRSGAGVLVDSGASFTASSEMAIWAASSSGSVIAAARESLVFLRHLASDAARAITMRREDADERSESATVSSLALSDSGSHMTVAYSDGSLYLAEVPSEMPASTRASSLRRVRTGRAEPARHLAVDRDGGLLATLSEDLRTVTLWTNDGRTAGRVTSAQDINTFLFHPTCDLFLTGGDDGAVRFWQLRRQRGDGAPADARPESAGDQRAPAAAEPAAPQKMLIEEKDLRIDRRHAPGSYVMALAVHQPASGSGTLAVADDEGRIELWTGMSCKGPLSWRSRVHREEDRKIYRDLRFSPDGASLAAVALRFLGFEERLVLWDTRLFPRSARWSAERVEAASFDSAHRTFSTVGSGGQLVRGGVQSEFTQYDVTAASFDAERDELLLGDEHGGVTRLSLDLGAGGGESTNRGIPTVRVQTSSRESGVRPGGSPVARLSSLHAHGEPVVLVATLNGRLQLAGTDAVSAQLPGGAGRSGPEVLLDAALAGNAHSLIVTSQGRILRWRPLEGQADATAERAAEPETYLLVDSIAAGRGRRGLVDPDGRFFIAFANDGALVNYDRVSGDHLIWRRGLQHSLTQQLVCSGITAATFRKPRGFFIGCSNGRVFGLTEQFDWITSAAFTTSTEGTASVTALVASPSRELLAAGTEAGEVVVWRGSTVVRRIPDASGRAIRAIAITSDDKFIAVTGDDGGEGPRVSVWAVEDEKADPKVFRGHAHGAVNDVQFSADDRWLLTAGDDRTAQVWAWREPGERVVSVARHSTRVMSLRWTGRQFISEIDPPVRSSDETARSPARYQLWDAAGTRVGPLALVPPDPSEPWRSWLLRACAALGGRPVESSERGRAFEQSTAACRSADGDGARRGEAAAARGDLGYFRSNWRFLRRRTTGALHEAAAAAEPAVALELLRTGRSADARDEYGRTPLWRAVERRHVGMVHLLLSAGADPNLADNLGNTPLHLAALNDGLGLVALLLSHLASPEAANALGVTPLMNAAEVGDSVAVTALLDRGASADAVDVTGRTALMDASLGARLEVVRKLLDHGADVNRQTFVSQPRYRATAVLLVPQTPAGEPVRKLLLNKDPEVTEGWMAATIRYPVKRYVPRRLETSLPDLAPWEHVGRPGPEHAESLARLEARGGEREPFIAFLVGRAYEVGIGTRADSQKSTEWYAKSTDWLSARRRARAPVEHGDELGQLALGLTAWNPPAGQRQNLNRTRELLEPLAAAGHPLALMYWSVYQGAIGTDPTFRRQTLERAVQAGEPAGMNAYGLLLDSEALQAIRGQGLGATDDYVPLLRDSKELERAVEMYRKAASQGDTFAKQNLHRAYLYGAGVAQSDEEAARWGLEAAKDGDARALRETAEKYLYGIGVAPSQDTARDLYAKGAAAENASAFEEGAWLREAARPGARWDRTIVEWYYRASVIGRNYVARQRLQSFGLKP